MSGNLLLIISILGLIVLVVLVLTILLYFYVKRQGDQRAREVDWLRKNGTRITAYVMDVSTTGDRRTSGSVDFALDELGGASYARTNLDYRASVTPPSYHVVAKGMHPQTHKYYNFKRTVSRDELPKHYTPGSDVSFEVSVLIDHKNPGRYYMELPPSS